MKRVKITREALEEIRRHSCEESPKEACGLLLGIRNESTFTVMRSYRARNLRGSPSSYEADPRDVYRALIEAERRGWELIGVYHSHPLGKPNPSALDAERAVQGLLYVIISLDGSFKVFEATGQGFLELECPIE